MKKEYKITEIYNAQEKNIEEKLKKIFISFLIEKSQETRYNQNNMDKGNLLLSEREVKK